MCCKGPTCTCATICNWGSSTWFEKEGLDFWSKFLLCIGHPVSNLQDTNVCLQHYKQLRKYLINRTCLICAYGACSTDDVLTWSLVETLKCHSLAQYNVLIGMLDEIPSPSDWICNTCCSLLSNDSNIELMFARFSLSNDPIVLYRANVLKLMLNALSKDGIVLNSVYIYMFQSELVRLDCNTKSMSRYIATLKKLMDKVVIMKGFLCFSPSSTRKGKLYYDPCIFTEASMPYMFKLLSNYCSADQMNTWMKEQVKLFPTNCSTFDYRTLVKDGKFDEDELAKYFNKDFEDFLLSATVSENQKHHALSSLYTFRRKLCIRMAISILCVAMNPSAIFFQTLVGLVCYAYGLRDFGFSILNMIECCCSIDHIRKHGSYWAKKRITSQELLDTGTKFWRVSFNNLNFKIKYAKKISMSGITKMLNLITSQVYCRETETLHNTLPHVY